MECDMPTAHTRIWLAYMQARKGSEEERLLGQALVALDVLYPERSDFHLRIMAAEFRRLGSTR
jgi:hypothetical protein